MKLLQPKIHFLSLICLLLWGVAAQAQVTFRASAPNTVATGEQFRLTFSLNKEGKDLKLPPEISNFEVLYGPAVSESHSTQIINGRVSSENSYAYTYILMPKKTGTFTIGSASVSVDGKTYKSNPLNIKVVAGSTQNSGGNSSQQRGVPRPTGNGTVTANDAFIRAIVSKNSVYEQEGFTVTFRLYTRFNVQNFGKIEFPEFEGFMVEEIELPSNQRLTVEQYNGKTYYCADLRKTLLFPQRSGKITIPSGKIEMVFSVPSGQRVESFFGTQEIDVDVSKTMTTNPISITVKPLPINRPASFANAVGEFSIAPSISTQKIRANEPINIVLEISGTGNLKLVQNPTVNFPSNFESDEPDVNNNLQVTTNGLTGFKKIEYTAIPRYEGNYTIPPIKFSYFDLRTGTFKTLSTPSYEIKVEKGDPNKAKSSNYGDDEEKLDKDIRPLNTNIPQFLSRSNAFVGSFRYWLGYIVPLLLLIVFYFFNKEKTKRNANVVMMRNRRANKVAVKRLKIAEKYLTEQKKELFYDEILKALWGYFSDKLSIPIANLTKDTIEANLTEKGTDTALTQRFIHILNTCEFARYAPAESDTAMNDLYNETVDAIGEMEHQLKQRK